MIDMHSLFKKFYMNEIFKFNYDAAELLLKAFEDYLKGPAFLEKADGEQIIKSNSKLNSKFEPISKYDDIDIRWIEDCYLDEPRNMKDKIFFHITKNGQMFSPNFVYKRNKRMPIAAFDFSSQRQKITRTKEYAAVNPFQETVNIRKLDKKRYRSLMEKYKILEKKYKKYHIAVDKAYCKAKPYMTSEKFWRKYLDI